MQKLKRNINMGFRVTAEERDLIMKRMDEIGFPSVRSYLLKMALNGMVINLDLTDVRECSRLLRNVSKVIKTGDNAEPLPGVVFGIFKDGEQLDTLTTGTDGTATSGALYYGAYELRELSTVNGYELLDISIPFSILTDGAVIEIPVTNPLIYGGVSILKTDGGEHQPVAEVSVLTSDNPLSGAVFGVYNGQEQLIAELTTDADGRAELSGLVMGDYFLREHTAPEGFAPIDYDIPFSITTQGEVFEITM